jgi:hypothetical protein
VLFGDEEERREVRLDGCGARDVALAGWVFPPEFRDKRTSDWTRSTTTVWISEASSLRLAQHKLVQTSLRYN